MKHEDFSSILTAIAIAGTLSGALVLGGCGGATYQTPRKASNMIISSDGTTTTPVTTADDSPAAETPSTTTPPSETGVPPYTYRVESVGYTSSSVTVETNRVLKVQFIPGTPDKTVAGTNFTAVYSQMGVYVKVGSSSQATEMLSNGLFGGEAQKSRILEFSNSFARTCNRLDSSCRQTVTVTVEKPNYDYFCLINYSCPWAQVWNTHPWNGTLLIQTDDTDALSTN